MPGTPRNRTSVAVDKGTYALIDSLAEVMDVATTSLIDAALTGLAHAGQVERFAHLGANANEAVQARLTVRRPRTPRRRWVADGGSTRKVEGTPVHGRRVVPTGTSVWRHGAWSLSYVGDAHRAGRKPAGEGWHLDGPGIIVSVPCGHVREEATEAADRYIDRYEAAQAPVPEAQADPSEAQEEAPGPPSDPPSDGLPEHPEFDVDPPPPGSRDGDS